MATSYHNNTKQIYAILAIALIWIFWPILSPTLLVLNYVAFLPFKVALAFILTFGESILFTISLWAFGLFVKDTLSKKGGEVTYVEGPPESEVMMPLEEKFEGFEEHGCESICDTEKSYEHEEATESKINCLYEPSQVTEVENDSLYIPITKLQDVIVVQDTLTDLVHDIIEDERKETEGADMSPSAC